LDTNAGWRTSSSRHSGLEASSPPSPPPPPSPTPSASPLVPLPRGWRGKEVGRG